MSEYTRTPNPPVTRAEIPTGFAAFLDNSGKKCLGIKEFTKHGYSWSVVPPITKPTRALLNAELVVRGIAQPTA